MASVPQQAKTVASVLDAADERLQTARFGLADMSNPERSVTGLYNAVVFGRMVTFALQNLRNLRPTFDEWYAPKVAEMRADPLMGYFYELRTVIEKTTERHIAHGHIIGEFRGMADMGPMPPGAVAFFIGDDTGRSGWRIRGADGSETPYYVDLPEEIVRAVTFLPNAPAAYAGFEAKDLVAIYLDKLEALIAEARATFNGKPSLRVVK